MDCVSYLKDRIRVRGHLRIGDMTNNARLEEQSTSMSRMAMLSEITRCRVFNCLKKRVRWHKGSYLTHEMDMKDACS